MRILIFFVIVASTVSCTENLKIIEGKPIVIQGKLYRCTEKAWPE